jgi:hypothetical protein
MLSAGAISSEFAIPLVNTQSLIVCSMAAGLSVSIMPLSRQVTAIHQALFDSTEI